MARPQFIGVSSTIRENQINHLSDPEQDELIKQEGRRLEGELRTFVQDLPPLSEVVFTVEGPKHDPLQGKVWVHTMAAFFDLDRLAPESPAYLTHVVNQPAAQARLEDLVDRSPDVEG